MSQDQRLDIEPEVRALCEKLGIGHDATLSIAIEPSIIRAKVALRNDAGKFYSEGANEILATRLVEVEVTT